jgi:prevent-host-death family protein
MEPIMNAPLIFNVHDAKTHFSKLLDRAHAGEELVLAKAGVPYARLMPLSKPAGKRQAGRLAHLNIVLDDRFFEPMPDAELANWGLI